MTALAAWGSIHARGGLAASSTEVSARQMEANHIVKERAAP